VSVTCVAAIHRRCPPCMHCVDRHLQRTAALPVRRSVKHWTAGYGSDALHVRDHAPRHCDAAPERRHTRCCLLPATRSQLALCRERSSKNVPARLTGGASCPATLSALVCGTRWSNLRLPQRSADAAALLGRLWSRQRRQRVGGSAARGAQQKGGGSASRDSRGIEPTRAAARA
jgi:hypothetical protein